MTTAAPVSPPWPRAEDTPEFKSICACFRSITLDVRDANQIAYLLTLVRAHPTKITHGPEHQDLRKAVRILLRVLPDMILSSEAEAADAARNGRTSDMGHFAWRARDLLAAAQPFASVAAPYGRDQRSWWHGYAHMIALIVCSVLRQHGSDDLGVGQPTSPAIIITHDLLALGGVNTDVDAIVAALRNPRQKRAVKIIKVT